MKKKVLYVITKSNFGGAQRYVFDLATSLPKENYEAVVAFGGTGVPGASAGKLEAMLHEAGVRTLFIKNFARDIFILKEFAALFELIDLFRKERPDIVHLNSSKAGGIGALAGRLVGVKKIVYTAHGWAYNEPVPFVTKLFRWTASLATLMLCHDVITVSHFDMTYSPLGLTTHVVHNGIPEPEFLEKSDAKSRLAVLASIPEDSFIIGTIAELHPNKGLDTLITAAAQVPETQFIIISEGESRAHLESLIKKHSLQSRVHLVGFVDNARILLKGLDIFVLPSRKEGLPYTILEAGAAGLPVVATTVGGIPDIIDDEINGLLVTPNDVTGLATAFNELIGNPNSRLRYGEELQKKVARYFNLRGMVKKTIEVYES